MKNKNKFILLFIVICLLLPTQAFANLVKVEDVKQVQQVRELKVKNDINKELKFEINAYKSEKINNKEYDWYSYQLNSGLYSEINCGPSVISMALKWSNIKLDKSSREIREDMGHRGIVYTDQIVNYLNKNNINTNYYDFVDNNFNTIKSIIDDGNIIILLGDFGVLRNGSRDNYGHFIVVYGYEVKEKDNISLIVHDPYFKNKKEYDFEIINKSVKNFWPYLIEVEGVDVDE